MSVSAVGRKMTIEPGWVSLKQWEFYLLFEKNIALERGRESFLNGGTQIGERWKDAYWN